jgi:DNA-binding transcriptional MerR regulator
VERSSVQAVPKVQLLKIGELARRAGVSIPTLKHYLREGLIAPARKTGKTMAWYDPALVERVKAIRELREAQFLPLDVIKETLGRERVAQDDLAAAEAIAAVLAKHGPRSRTRAEMIAAGASETELEWLARAGLAVAHGPEERYTGDDLAILSTLGASRRAGIRADMLPFPILGEYLAAIRALVDIELRMFRAGVLGKARGAELARLTTAATRLSERLVVLVRRKLLLPTLHRLTEEDADGPDPVASRSRRVRQRAPRKRTRS